MSVVTFKPGQIRSPEDINRYLAELDKERGPLEEHPYDRRLRERATEKEREAKQTKEVEAARQNASEWSAWAQSVQQSLANGQARLNCLEAMILPSDMRSCGDDKPAGLVQIIGECLGAVEGKLHREIAALKGELKEMKERIATTTGQLPQVKVWRPQTVAYQGALFVRGGSLYQARRDNATCPGVNAADWVCIARAGRDGVDGEDGVSLTPRGAYKSDETYDQNDIVTYGGSAYIAKRNDPHGLPLTSSDWTLLSEKGGRGERGKQGAKGPRGEKGDTSPSKIARWGINREHFITIPFFSDGTAGPTLPLRKFFEEFVMQTTG